VTTDDKKDEENKENAPLQQQPQQQEQQLLQQRWQRAAASSASSASSSVASAPPFASLSSEAATSASASSQRNPLSPLRHADSEPAFLEDGVGADDGGSKVKLLQQRKKRRASRHNYAKSLDGLTTSGPPSFSLAAASTVSAEALGAQEDRASPIGREINISSPGIHAEEAIFYRCVFQRAYLD